MIDVAARHYIGLYARLRAQYARHVFGLRARERRGGFIPMFGNPAAACHRFLPCSACTSVILSQKQIRGTLEALP